MSRDRQDYFDDPEATAEAEAQAEQDALEAELDDMLEDSPPRAARKSGGLGEGLKGWGRKFEGEDRRSQKEAALEVLDGLQQENGELKDRALRLTAEMENLRKRTAREVKDAKTYATSNFARDMLSVADNLARALEAVPAEKREEGSEAFKALIEGVEMTRRELHNALGRNGVEPIEADGARFDPNVHQAMYEVPNPEVPSGMVAQVVAPGYTIGERVLRPAMVGVTKGGPKPQAEGDQGAETEAVPEDGSHSDAA